MVLYCQFLLFLLFLTFFLGGKKKISYICTRNPNRERNNFNHIIIKTMKLTIEKNDTIVTGILEGRLDTAASTQFAIDMEELIENADKHIVLNCEKMEFISSSGLRLFLSLRKKTISQGGDVTIKGAIPAVKQVFAITGFTALFKFED